MKYFDLKLENKEMPEVFLKPVDHLRPLAEKIHIDYDVPLYPKT